MEQLERIEQLKERQKELYDHWKYMKQMVTFKLYELLDQLNIAPLPIFKTGDEIVEIDIPYSYGEKDAEWEVRETIYFKNDEGKRDFASDICLYIDSKRISVNIGTCGRWDLRDKGQWSRILLLKEIFYHEEDIIRELSKIVDVSEIDERYAISRELDQINRTIQQAKNEEERKEWIVKIKNAKWLGKLGKHWEYDKGPDGFIDPDSPGKYINHYYNLEKINKVTDKSILTNECDNDGSPYNWINHRLDLSSVISKLKRKDLYLITDLNEFPPQDEGSK